MTTPENDPFLGEIVGGRYQVVARIGRGAMGTIYEVRHTKLKRSFALKRLMPHLADDKEALERFQREADVVAGLRHPNVVEIVDWETLADGTPCIVMELLRGENLEQRMARVGKLGWPELFAVADQVLSALAVAHRAGIVHRDLKPQNIYLARDDSGDERCKLLDFGISKVQGSGHTSVGAVIGTPAYMAPEQADSRHAEIGPGTDLWALGVILYELATGTQPFQGLNGSAVLYKVCYGAAEPIAQRRPDGDPRFFELVDQLLRKPVAERPVDAEAVRSALRAIAQAAPAAAPEPADHTITEVRALPANSTTLSAATGHSIELPVEPPRASRWPLVAGVVALAVIVVALALRPHTSGSHPAVQPVQPVAAPQAVPPKLDAPEPNAPAPHPLTPAMLSPVPKGKVGHGIVGGADAASLQKYRSQKRPSRSAAGTHAPPPAAAKKAAEPRPLDPD